MRGQSPPVRDEYNEDTDKANDSDDDQWDDNKLIIDLDSSNNMNQNDASKTVPNMSSPTVASKENINEDNQLTSDMKSNQSETANNTTPKPKGKRGTNKKTENNTKQEQTKETAKTNLKQSKSEKQQQDKEKTANKPGRKKKEKPGPTNVKPTNDNKGLSKIAEDSEQNASNSLASSTVKDEGISATTSGKRTTKNKSEPVLKDAESEYDWRSVGSFTEPENLGPCEPGTHVCLEGIVWQETNNGVLIVNVTWRGKTYMGALLDATKHDWSPPSCESPIGDFEGRTPKGRSKRSRVPLSDTFKDINERKLRKEMRRQSGTANQQPSSPAKSDSSKRKGRNSEAESTEPNSKRARAASRNGRSVTPCSPQGLIECPEPNCGKKYKQMNGLKYHQRNAHNDNNTNVSDTNSDQEKPESIPSPEEPRKSLRKAKSEKHTKADDRSDFKDDSEREESNLSTADVVNSTSSTKTNSSIVTNTVSVIASTSNQLPFTQPSSSQLNAATLSSLQTSTTQLVTAQGPGSQMLSSSAPMPTSMPSGSVPVAAITPQVMKPSDGIPPTTVPSVSRSLPLQTKLLPKSSSNSMAPISTMTSQGVFNSLKPIQPKPTILGEATPNPSFNELRDHKKLKRRRSVSRDDLSSNSPISYDQKRADMELRPNTNSLPESSHVLQSPAYSDISDNGDQQPRNPSVKRELITSGPLYSSSSSTSSLVATVSPQKNFPLLDKDTRPKSATAGFNSSMTNGEDSRRPIDKLSEQENKELMKHFSPYMSTSSWPSSLSKASGMSSISSKEVDSKASNERYQFLKENKDMNPGLPMHSSGMMDPSRDFPSLGRPSAESLKFSHDAGKISYERNELKRDPMMNISPASKLTGSKPQDSKHDMSRTVPRSSPMLPPTASNYSHFFANPMLLAGFTGLPGPMMNLSRGIPMFPMQSDLKDTKSLPPHFMGKSEHKIHELDSMRKSPRPNSTNDRNPSKTQPGMPPTSSIPPGMFGFHNLSYGPK